MEKELCVMPIKSQFGTSLVAQLLKNLPAVLETWFQSLGWEDPLEKRKATLSSTMAWRIPWTEEPYRYMGSQKVRHGSVTLTFTFQDKICGNVLQAPG